MGARISGAIACGRKISTFSRVSCVVKGQFKGGLFFSREPSGAVLPGKGEFPRESFTFTQESRAGCVFVGLELLWKSSTGFSTRGGNFRESSGKRGEFRCIFSRETCKKVLGGWVGKFFDCFDKVLRLGGVGTLSGENEGTEVFPGCWG